MNRQTAQTLNRINQDFYHHCAEDFSATRQSPWKGWERLVEHIRSRSGRLRQLAVLDVGCGNGRFAHYLGETSIAFDYIGIDISTRALDYARSRIPEGISTELIQHDLLAEEILPREARRPFSLIVAFGLLHHVPGYARRQAILAELAQRLDYQGILAVSIWQFGRFDRFKNKIVPWDEFASRSGVSIDTSQLDPGDYILSWGADPPAHRYCHFIDSEEAGRLAASLPLEHLDAYDADGFSNSLNRYYLFRRSTR
jgi:SAM-dependent methyltransferase